MEAVAFTPNGRYLLTGGHDRNIRAFQTNDLTLVLTKPVYRQEYYDFTADGQLLVSAHEDGTVRLWLVFSEPENSR